MFNTLYNDIKDCRIDNSIDNSQKESDIYRELFHNKTITWISDDYPKEIAPSFTIEKLTNAFIIKFTKLKTNKDELLYNFIPDNLIAVRICNSGSYYRPFNVVFMKLYNALSKIEEEYSQIHIEEYLIDKEISEKRTSLKRILLKK